MAEITAKLVNDLRAKTGQGMMECKKMLTEAGGDLDRAVDLFRKKGVKASLAERAASEGRVFGAKSADGKSAALIEINCNTDFTARSEPVTLGNWNDGTPVAPSSGTPLPLAGPTQLNPPPI